MLSNTGERCRKGNEDVAKIIRRMQVEEDTRHTHRRIKLATKPFGGAVTRLSIIDEDSPEGRRTTTNQHEIEEALMTEYESKYRLSYSSPLMQYPLRDVCPSTINRRSNAYIPSILKDG